MEFRTIWALRGPNYWANFPVLEALVDLDSLHDRSSEEIPGFNERLKGWLPSMIEHRCSVGERGGFFQRLDRGTYMAHILEHVALELQALAGTPSGFGRSRSTDEVGVYRVVIDYEDEAVGRAVLELGRRLCLAAVHDEPLDLAGELAQLKELNYDVRLGPSSMAILAAARKRNIPYLRLNRASLVQLGYGAKSRRVCTAETDRTGALAEAIAQDKQLTRTLLRAVGVPVPIGRPVEDEDDAWRAAEEIGVPVVVKPQYGNHGRGVATNLSTRQQVAAAYRAAREEGSHIMVEQFAPGEDHRMFVVGNTLVAAARREPAHVIGNGRLSIVQLVAEVNRDPRRSDGHSTVLSFIKIDAIATEVLSEQGYAPESVPAAGVKVLIRRNGNLSTGGTATDVTDLVHLSIAAQMVDAARIVGLDVAGVDVVATDISRPLEEQRGMVVEVNAGPGLRMHVDPSLGQPRPVGEAFIDLLFPAGENGRIPIIGVSGTTGTAEVCRLTARLLAESGTTVGLVSREGVFVGEQRLSLGRGDTLFDGQHCNSSHADPCGPELTRALLINPRVEAMVVEVSPLTLLTGGLAYDRGSIGVITEIAEGPLSDLPELPGVRRLDDMEQRVRTFASVADAVLPEGTVVLNADDPNAAAWLGKQGAKRIFFSRDRNHSQVVAHCQAGGRAVVATDDALVLLDGSRSDSVPLRGRDATLPLLAAVATAWATGLTLEQIRLGLASLKSGEPFPATV